MPTSTRWSRFHKQRNALATIGLVECDEVDQYGVVITDERGRIVEFQEKPPKGTERSKLVNTGIYVFEPEIFDYIPAATFYDFGKGVFPALLAAGARLLRHAADRSVLARHRNADRIPRARRATCWRVGSRLPGARAHRRSVRRACSGATA